MNHSENLDNSTELDVLENQPSGPTGPKRKRKPPKSPTEQLAEFEAKAASLREILEEQRVKLRDEFMEDLYKKRGIDPIKGDPNECERLRQLRETLEM